MLSWRQLTLQKWVGANPSIGSEFRRRTHRNCIDSYADIVVYWTISGPESNLFSGLFAADRKHHRSAVIENTPFYALIRTIAFRFLEPSPRLE